MITILMAVVGLALLFGILPMTNLTSTTPRMWRKVDERVITVYPASGALFAGSAVEEDGSGNMQNLTAAGTTFTGIAMQNATAAADRIEVATKGECLLSIAKGSAIAATDLGATVYAGDGNDFNLTSTSRQAIGKIVEVPAAAIGQNTALCWVYIEGQGKRSL